MHMKSDHVERYQWADNTHHHKHNISRAIYYDPEFIQEAGISVLECSMFNVQCSSIHAYTGHGAHTMNGYVCIRWILHRRNAVIWQRQAEHNTMDQNWIYTVNRNALEWKIKIQNYIRRSIPFLSHFASVVWASGFISYSLSLPLSDRRLFNGT